MSDIFKPIKLDRNIKAIPIQDRIIPELIIGNYYYVCFDKVYYCKLIEILRDGKMVRIEKFQPNAYTVPLLGKGAKLYIRYNTLYSDEIGLTPIQAMQHR